MNLSMLPLYGATLVAKQMRALATALQEKADIIDASKLLSKEQRVILQRNAIFQNKHKGLPGYVIVNGPSLATQDITRLKNEITFVVSGFWKHEVINIWEPTYYSLLDSNYFSDTSVTRDFYESLHQRVKTSTFFVPLFRGYDAVKSYGLLPPDRTFYVASVGTPRPCNDLTNIVPSFAGVSVFALSQAIYMGCNPIYLLGFDHDYLANRGVDRHFYTGGTLSGHPATNIPLGDRIPYDEEMRANLRLWANYHALKNIAEANGIQIYNATKGGYLDVFPRGNFEDILKY